MKTPFKITEELAADIRARVKSFDIEAIEKARRSSKENGTFDVIISTEQKDRAGETVMQDGWELENYKNNPIVLWGHDYYSLPIGVCTDLEVVERNGVKCLRAKGVFLSADINPFAQQVRRLYEFGLDKGEGVGCTTSVGFISRQRDEQDWYIITRAELLEFSFVPVPANQGVGAAEGRALTLREARSLGIDVESPVMRTKGFEFTETLGMVPANASSKKADATLQWKQPTLADFTEKAWSDLSAAEKKDIAGRFAYATSESLESFEDLKLAHHAADGSVVWAGVKAAMGALMGYRGGVDEGDRKAVYDHLAEHYKEFGAQAPEFAELKEAQPGDECEMPDGSAGVYAVDPENEDGPLVCVAKAQKSDEGNASQKSLIKSITEEHARHANDTEKCIETLEIDGKNVTVESVKDVRYGVQDEQVIHRARSVGIFKEFKAQGEKSFDKSPFLKAVREQHDAYEAQIAKIVGDFEEKCAKATTEDATGAFATAIEDAQRAHKKAVIKIAKAMCKEVFGQEEQADEKTLEILTNFLAPHIDKQILPALVAKIGARLTTEKATQLSEAHQHLKAATSILEKVFGSLADGSEDESRSDVASKADENGSRGIRSKKRAPSTDPELKAHLDSREALRDAESAIRGALGKINLGLRNRNKN
ncbi:hypothetical protein [Rhodopseudomonas palustris]|uniref:hypothetical protein n=1 Tax=Rhodopseudomonas palustris TaxID=1076 RepID=UPI000D19A14D|nr:hypothetical protein [Rhodopseudomonas palustris]AVT83672.1 hypothetical protein RPYSC3_48120 [Rhodopseudomonas palustris]